MSKKITFIDLFAGIGGFRLGFESIGCECVFSSEYDKYSKQTYKENFLEEPHGEITKIKEKEIPSFDILTAGFPCQPFSSIGLREGFSNKSQGTLFYDIVRILSHHKPKGFLLENVPGIISHNNGETISIIFNSLNSIGYDVWYKIIDSADYGVPQRRRRIYIAGIKSLQNQNSILVNCSKDNSSLFANSISKERFLFPEVIKDKVGIGKFVESGVKGYSVSKHLQKSYLFKINDGKPEIIDCNTPYPVKTLCSSYYKIQRLTGTFVRDGETGIRLLTTGECKSIMGFPKTFVIPVSRTQMYKQMGNSVVVPVVSAIAKSLVKSIQKIQ